MNDTRANSGEAFDSIPSLPKLSLSTVSLAQELALLTLVGVVYLGAAKLGLSLAFLHESVSPVWPPTGVAIAAVLLLGYRVWPAILIAAFLANLATATPVASAAGIAVGNTLEAQAAAFLLSRFVGRHSPFFRTPDVLKFVLIAGAISPAVSATIGAASLCLSGAAAWAHYGSLWLTWWMGDGAGALVVAPLLISWIAGPRERWPSGRLIEAALVLFLLAAVAAMVFGGLSPRLARYPLEHLTIPFILWAALRFGQQGASTALGVLSGIAVWTTTQGLGPFREDSTNESLLFLQVFVSAAAITALVLAAAVSEYQRARADISFLASIVESTEDAVIGKTLDGVVRSWNEGASRLYGFEAREMIGRPISALVPYDRKDELERIFDKLRRGEQVHTFETVRVRKDGTRVHIALTVSPIKSSSGEIVAASAIARDITDQKRAEDALRESEAQLRLALEAADMGAWEYDIRNQSVRWSKGLEAIHGLAPGSFGGTFDDFLRDIHPEDRQYVIDSLARTIASSNEHEIEYRIIRPDGQARWVEGKGQVLRDESGNAIRLTGVCMDVSERKQAEAARERLLVLEQTARAEAEAANRAKDEFLAVVSHELRTPLNAIVGWIDVLLSQEQRDESLTARALEVMRRNAGLQVRLVEDILDVSRIIAGQLQLDLRKVDLGAVVRSCVQAMQPAAEAQGVQLIQGLDDPVDPIIGDTNRLQQIVWNLLSNAIKFTPRGGSVEIELRQQGSDARIIVSDTGEGIASGMLPFIFDRFRQADSSTTRKYGGLGLGLAIAKHLVELHGGTIVAYSPGENQGSVFTLTFPSIKASSRKQADQKPSLSRDTGVVPDAPVLAGLRILVVDDDNDSRDLLAFMLELRGADVRSTDSARGALRVLDEWNPHVLISDLGMPEEDGYDLIREVRARDARERGFTPAIALTGYAAFAEGERALAAGYQAHFAKPVEPQSLVNAVASVVALRERVGEPQA